MPNLMLHVRKREACSSAPRKKPASAMAKHEVQGGGEEEEQQQQEQDQEQEEEKEEEEGEEGEEEAAMEEAPVEEAAMEEAAEEKEGEAKLEAEKYLKMWYKRNNSIGIRQRFGQKRQIMSFGCKLKTREALENIADAVIEKLEKKEMSEEEGRVWARSMAMR